MRLGIDLDGVVADFNKGWIDRYNAEFGSELKPESVTMWDGMEQLTHFPDIPAFWKWAEDFGNGSLFRHLETYPAAVPALERLAAQHEIVIITTKPDWGVSDTLAWIADHELPTREVHVVEWSTPKWSVLCDVYLDDAPRNIEGITLNRPDKVMCRFVRPWNEPAAGARDVHDWAEFEALVAGIGS
jgi:5'(3')-deoxyribonucleotidase